MVDYPSTLPCPQIDGYQVGIDPGRTAVLFENGGTRQRQQFKQDRHVFVFSLVLTSQQLWQWQSWANQYGYDWHNMTLVSNYAGVDGEVMSVHSVRYISDISIDVVDQKYFRVTVSAEMDLNVPPKGGIVTYVEWIIGGTPDAPSSSNYVIAGTPAALSTPDFIIASAPGFPAT